MNCRCDGVRYSCGGPSSAALNSEQLCGPICAPSRFLVDFLERAITFALAAFVLAGIHALRSLRTTPRCARRSIAPSTTLVRWPAGTALRLVAQMQLADRTGAQRARLQFERNAAVGLAQSAAGADHFALFGDQQPHPLGAIIVCVACSRMARSDTLPMPHSARISRQSFARPMVAGTFGSIPRGGSRGQPPEGTDSRDRPHERCGGPRLHHARADRGAAGGFRVFAVAFNLQREPRCDPS